MLIAIATLFWLSTVANYLYIVKQLNMQGLAIASTIYSYSENNFNSTLHTINSKQLNYLSLDLFLISEH